MYLILDKKSINKNNLKIYKKTDDLYFINNKFPFVSINGLALDIVICGSYIHNNMQYLYIDDKETIDLLLRIEGYLLSYINNLKLLKKYNNKYYIVLSKVFNITTNKVTINIKYIKKKNINKYIAIITIL
ncbi:MAG: hypothetical protein CMG46_02575 [Candidatus Marinimicrobia bacterium]|nr:hypothetical protein [Candidatus Neomarinimicrobiota bacterium]